MPKNSNFQKGNDIWDGLSHIAYEHQIFFLFLCSGINDQLTLHCLFPWGRNISIPSQKTN